MKNVVSYTYSFLFSSSVYTNEKEKKSIEKEREKDKKKLIIFSPSSHTYIYKYISSHFSFTSIYRPSAQSFSFLLHLFIIIIVHFDGISHYHFLLQHLTSTLVLRCFSCYSTPSGKLLPIDAFALSS